MAWNWLFGAPVVNDGFPSNVSFGSSFTITISHVREIVDRLKEDGATEVKVCKMHRGTMPAPWMEASTYEVDLTPNSSDDTLSAVSVSAIWPMNSAQYQVRAEVALGARVPARVMVSVTNEHVQQGMEIARRVTDVVTSGQRHIPSWKWVQFGRVAAGALLAALGASAAWALRGDPVIAAVALLAVLGFSLEISPRLTKALAGTVASIRHGVVSIDATPLEKVRADRRQRRTNWRVATLSVAGTLVAGALTAWLTGLWTP